MQSRSISSSSNSDSSKTSNGGKSPVHEAKSSSGDNASMDSDKRLKMAEKRFRDEKLKKEREKKMLDGVKKGIKKMLSTKARSPSIRSPSQHNNSDSMESPGLKRKLSNVFKPQRHKLSSPEGRGRANTVTSERMTAISALMVTLK